MKNKTFLVLIIIFLVVVLGGHYIFNTQSAPSVDLDETPAGTSSVATTRTDNTDETNKKTTPTSTLVQDSQGPTCVETLRSQIQAKKQSYAKGHVLVTFQSTITYAEAKDVLAVYGLVVQNEIDSQSSYKSMRLVTAASAPGQELTKVCQLRSDSHVKFATLDFYFGLHE